MAHVKLRWTRIALADMAEAYDFIAADEPAAATRVLRCVDDAIALLRRFPDMGRPGRVKGTRELVVVGTPFVVPYRVKGDRVEILAVLHGSRRWPERL